MEQWAELSHTIKEHKLLPFFDCAYQGFASPIMTNAGLEVRKYRYYDVEKSDLQFDNMIKDIKEMPQGSCLLLHACAHNPTG